MELLNLMGIVLGVIMYRWAKYAFSFRSEAIDKALWVVCFIAIVLGLLYFNK